MEIVVEMQQTQSWRRVLAAIKKSAIPLGQRRGVPIEAMTEDDECGTSRFTIVAKDRGALVMQRRIDGNTVNCHWELPGQYVWDACYQIDADGGWSGPFAKRAEYRRFVGADVIAKEIIDAWLIEVIPHH